MSWIVEPLDAGEGGFTHWLPPALVGLGLGVFGFSEEAAAQGIEIDQVFWCDESVGPLGDQLPEECLAARDTLLSSCTSCHTFAPVVLSQYSEEEWESFMTRHRERVPDVSDEAYDQLKEFLKVHYNPDTPPPDLPEALRNYTLPPA